jgi:DHA1 family bicyclomycin/chloramphenicol resistance-like MFS transporter
MAFTLLLGFLVALPSFGIDMSLPALTAIGATLMASEFAGIDTRSEMLRIIGDLAHGSTESGRRPRRAEALQV